MSTDNGSSIPKSMRHKRILDAAAENPDASLEALAAEVPSVSPELVERVLKEYGDPADDGESDDGSSTDGSTDDAGDRSTEETATAGTPADETPDGPTGSDAAETKTGAKSEPDSEEGSPDPDDLTSKQRETLAVVAARPDATQREVADRLGVSAATVSKRVNSVEGFEWSNRASLVEAVFDEQPPTPVTTDGGSTPGAGGDAASGDSDGSSQSGTDDSSSTDPDQGPTTDEQSATTTAPDRSPQPTDPDGASPTTDSDSSTTDLDAAIQDLESRVTDLEAARNADSLDGSVLEDPDLVHKVVHACMESDTISEEEELRILRALLA